MPVRLHAGPGNDSQEGLCPDNGSQEGRLSGLLLLGVLIPGLLLVLLYPWLFPASTLSWVIPG